MDTIKKIIELNHLLNSGAITKDEFEKIKSNIIDGSNEISPKINAQRIILKSFVDISGVEHKAPEVTFIDINNITDEEISKLKTFISSKQKHAPSQMTKDEIEIGNKIFSSLEIAQINSQREGFNHPYEAIFGIIGISASIFALTISPCMAVLGAGTGTIASAFMAYSLLKKADSTKLDRIFGQVISLGVLIAIVIFMTSKV